MLYTARSGDENAGAEKRKLGVRNYPKTLAPAQKMERTSKSVEIKSEIIWANQRRRDDANHRHAVGQSSGTFRSIDWDDLQRRRRLRESAEKRSLQAYSVCSLIEQHFDSDNDYVRAQSVQFFFLAHPSF